MYSYKAAGPRSHNTTTPKGLEAALNQWFFTLAQENETALKYFKTGHLHIVLFTYVVEELRKQIKDGRTTQSLATTESYY